MEGEEKKSWTDPLNVPKPKKNEAAATPETFKIPRYSSSDNLPDDLPRMQPDRWQLSLRLGAVMSPGGCSRRQETRREALQTSDELTSRQHSAISFFFFFFVFLLFCFVFSPLPLNFFHPKRVTYQTSLGSLWRHTEHYTTCFTCAMQPRSPEAAQQTLMCKRKKKKKFKKGTLRKK